MSSASDGVGGGLGGTAGPPSSAKKGALGVQGREQRRSARRGKLDGDALNNSTNAPSATADLGASLLKNSNLFSSFVVKNKLQAGVSKKAAGGSTGWQLVLKTALSSLQKEEVDSGPYSSLERPLAEGLIFVSCFSLSFILRNTPSKVQVPYSSLWSAPCQLSLIS